MFRPRNELGTYRTHGESLKRGSLIGTLTDDFPDAYANIWFITSSCWTLHKICLVQWMLSLVRTEVKGSGPSWAQIGATSTRLSECIGVRFLSYSCFGLQCYNQSNSFEPSPFREAFSHSVTQEFPNILWNQNFNFRSHKNLTLIPILS